MKFFAPGTDAFIVANGRRVRPVRILYEDHGLYTLLFLDNQGVSRLKKGRLFATKEDAEKTIKRNEEIKGPRDPHSFGWLI